MEYDVFLVTPFPRMFIMPIKSNFNSVLFGFFIISKYVIKICQTDFEDESQDKENESLDPVDKVVQFNLQPTYHEIKPGKPRCKSGKIERGPFKYSPSLSFTVCLCVCVSFSLRYIGYSR